MHSLSLKVWLASKWNIALIPVEPLVETINSPIFTLVCCVYWFVDAFVLAFSLLSSQVLQLVFVALELQQLGASLEDWVERNLVFKTRRVHSPSLIKCNHAKRLKTVASQSWLFHPCAH